MAPGEGVGVSVMGEVQTEVVLTTTISYLSWLGTHSGFAGVESQAQEFKVLTNQPAIFGLAQAVMREQHTWLSSGFRPKAPDKAKRTSLPTERAVRQVLSKLLQSSVHYSYVSPGAFHVFSFHPSFGSLLVIKAFPLLGIFQTFLTITNRKYIYLPRICTYN